MAPPRLLQFDFRWVRRDSLAGTSLPGRFGPLAGDLALLESHRIRLLVTLTVRPLDLAGLTHGLDQLHFPIPDMGIPTPRATHDLCTVIDQHRRRGEAVALHCRAGLGRTGTLLACCLVHDGLEADAAIREVRSVCAHHIQSSVQEQFVRHYADFHRADLLDGSSDSTTSEGARALPPLRLPETKNPS